MTRLGKIFARGSKFWCSTLCRLKMFPLYSGKCMIFIRFIQNVIFIPFIEILTSDNLTEITCCSHISDIFLPKPLRVLWIHIIVIYKYLIGLKMYSAYLLWVKTKCCYNIYMFVIIHHSHKIYQFLNFTYLTLTSLSFIHYFLVILADSFYKHPLRFL